MPASAARQELPVAIVFGRLQVERCRQRGAVLAAHLEAERHPFQSRTIHVVRRAVEVRVALERDQLLDAVAIGDRTRLDRRAGDAAVPVGTGFEILRGLRDEVGVREAGVIKVVERRRLEAGAVADRDAPGRGEPIPVRDGARRLAAVLGGVVAAQIRLQRVRVDAQLVDPEQRVRRARRRRKAGIGRHLLLAPLVAGGQRAYRQRELVLPHILALRRPEREVAVPGLGLAVVQSFARRKPRHPE